MEEGNPDGRRAFSKSHVGTNPAEPCSVGSMSGAPPPIRFYRWSFADWTRLRPSQQLPDEFGAAEQPSFSSD